MQVSEFDFDLPTECIAQKPAEPRDSARLLHVGTALSDHAVSELPGLLEPGDVLVCNDTRVIPARLVGRRGDATHPGRPERLAKIEVTLHKPDNPSQWRAFARPAKKLKPRDLIAFGPGFNAVVWEKLDGGEVVLRFNVGGRSLLEKLHAHGIMPLPPYIKRQDAGDNADREDYQTLFAANDGAVAAPTAGLHFTPRLMEALDARGVKVVRLTLHVGAGTFLPVKVDDTADHVMHGEWGEISESAADAVNKARAGGGRVVAVGSTSLRLLESAASADGHVAPFRGETDLFITPGYEFKVVDRLLTNFHLPKSTLFMMVAAFSGLETMRGAYDHAIQSGYRFYSYGDACLLERNTASK